MDEGAAAEWRPVAGYEGRYEVSSGGEVRNAKTGRVLRPTLNAARRYLTVGLSSGSRGSRKTRTVHTLVARAFIGEPTVENYLVRHLDGNVLNNGVDNLAFGNHSDNAKDSVRHGTNYISKQQNSFQGSKTHCPRGHEYTEDNTQINTRGARVCRACGRERYYQKRDRT